MPELPEVETIKNDLEPHLVGRRFSDVALFWPDVVSWPSPEELVRRLPGQRAKKLERRGKYLIFELSSGHSLIIHLKMSGNLLLNPDEDGPYIRASFKFDDGTRLVFADRRKLGRIWLVADKEEVVKKLGPEPLHPAFTPQVLAQRLSRRPGPIKAVLLDQGALAGLGNMYADEALFEAGLHPLRPASSLSAEEVERLHRAIRQVLSSAVGNRGASTDSYVDAQGQKGTAHFQFKVAHRRGGACPRCRTPIERLALRNRGTYFCPRCQKGPRL
ncbi:MAG TPA: bifunctional DNA-formamidopyrimidine glycosylase/DNA-(apurinic or apyrimidinic site) lyase [Dehalococcoidia bacterium]|nr:bifunctional DNA-formamidopyrimidine glycosylase/DNA-(apurinic or apyrimidinic site) lyase [Dehalococcoidia bacterium]